MFTPSPTKHSRRSPATASAGQLAWLYREQSVDYLSLMPVYLRAPQAERERARRLGGRA